MTPEAMEAVAELKPCPFCGGKPKWTDLRLGMTIWWTIRCRRQACKGSSGSFPEKEETAAAWNRRVEGAPS